MAGDELDGYSLVFDFREDWEAAIEEGLAMAPEATVQGDSIECVGGAALDWLIGPGKITELKNMVTISLSSVTPEYADERPWYLPETFGVGLIYRGVNVGLQWPIGSEPVDEYVVDFNRAENGLLDRIVFDVGSGQGSSGQAIVELTLNMEKSRAGGFEAADLLSGNAVVDDPCTLEKLDQRDVYGGSELRVGGDVLGSDGSFGTGGGSGGASGGTSSRMCIFAFFVNNVFQYSFTSPCNAFEKEQISE